MSVENVQPIDGIMTRDRLTQNHNLYVGKIKRSAESSGKEVLFYWDDQSEIFAYEPGTQNVDVFMAKNPTESNPKLSRIREYFKSYSADLDPNTKGILAFVKKFRFPLRRG